MHQFKVLSATLQLTVKLSAQHSHYEKYLHKSPTQHLASLNDCPQADEQKSPRAGQRLPQEPASVTDVRAVRRAAVARPAADDALELVGVPSSHQS